MTPETESAAPPNRVLDACASLIEAALDRALRLDAGSGELLRRLDLRELRLTLRGAARGLRLRIADGRVRPIPDAGGEADLALAIEPGPLLGWLASPGTRNELPAGIRIAGDLDLARTVETALRDFDPDWELPFTDLFGHTLGPQFARGLGAALDWGRRQAGDLAASAAEFATEETRILASRAELEAFNQDVDRLRDDVERLAARLQRLGRGQDAA